MADIVAAQAFQISSLLSETWCSIIKQITTNYDYIEVLPKGCFFKISEKKFVFNQEDLDGSPRAFVIYKYTGKVPRPKPFIEGTCIFNSVMKVSLIFVGFSKVIISQFLGIENSFPNAVVRRKFLQKYYQILLHGKFPKKESKLMLVGPPDSGKTSWFCPFEGEVFTRKPCFFVYTCMSLSFNLTNHNIQLMDMD